MDRRLTEATGGLSVARFEVLCLRRRARCVSDAKAKAWAIRAKPAVEAAVAERTRVLADADAELLAARADLAVATKALFRYGTVGLDMIGLGPSDLRRLARRPPRT